MQKQRFQLSLEIIHCDGFTSLPATAQALYVQIVSVCDDEGMTAQLNLCKNLAHASDDDVKALIDQEFIYQVGKRKVTVVKHWTMNTYLNPNKVNQSKFSERSLLFLKPNGNYTLNPDEGKPLEPIKSEVITDLGRNEDGASTDTFRNTPSSHAAPYAAPRAAPPAAPTQSNPYQSNPYQSNTLHSNPNDISPASASACKDDDDPWR